MADQESRTPPAGEEIHLPEGSLQPLGLAFGVTVALVGVTVSYILCILGGLLALAVLVRWISDARKELEHLPLHAEGEEHIA